MTIGSGIAIAAIWSAVAVTAVYGGWLTILVAAVAYWTTGLIVLGRDAP